MSALLDYCRNGQEIDEMEDDVIVKLFHIVFHCIYFERCMRTTQARKLF